MLSHRESWCYRPRMSVIEVVEGLREHLRGRPELGILLEASDVLPPPLPPSEFIAEVQWRWHE
jgi:hypothetical protein